MANRLPAPALTRRKLCGGGALVALAWASGCSTLPPPLPPLAAGVPLRIVVGSGTLAAGPPMLRNQAVGEGVSAGAGTGAIAGGLWGLTCGPFAVLCVPLGATAGLLSGSAAGALVGATAALPADKAARLRERLQQVQPASRQADTLRQELLARARERWTLVDDPAAAAATLTLDLLTLELRSSRDEQVALVLRVDAALRPAATAASPVASAVARRHYEQIGPPVPLALWLDDSSDFLATSFGNALRQVAAQVVAELGQR